MICQVGELLRQLISGREAAGRYPKGGKAPEARRQLVWIAHDLAKGLRTPEGLLDSGTGVAFGCDERGAEEVQKPKLSTVTVRVRGEVSQERDRLAEMPDRLRV